MPITRTPRQQSQDDIVLETPAHELFDDVDNERKPAVEEDRYEKLAEQMANLQREMQETQRANMALLSQSNTRVNDHYVEVKPETVALPDPALDPEGYEQAVAKRTEIRNQNTQRRQEFDNRQRSRTEERVNDLWESFSTEYADIAENEDSQERIDFIASKLVKKAQKRGIDVERYMFTTQDKFMADVAAEYEKTFGAPDVDEDDNRDEQPRSRNRNRSVDTSSRNRPRNRNRGREEEMVSRTGGIFGGNESGGRASGRRDDIDDGPSMIDDIQTMQKKTGFF